ncbi:MAG: hypothetical protein IJT94_11305, partial [Oscillibacter sp.]|nr:hypothetical protein [Oscillibacter sp.]
MKSALPPGADFQRFTGIPRRRRLWYTSADKKPEPSVPASGAAGPAGPAGRGAQRDGKITAGQEAADVHFWKMNGAGNDFIILNNM